MWANVVNGLHSPIYRGFLFFSHCFHGRLLDFIGFSILFCSFLPLLTCSSSFLLLRLAGDPGIAVHSRPVQVWSQLCFRHFPKTQWPCEFPQPVYSPILCAIKGEVMHLIGEGDGTPLQCSCLENPRDRGAWWAAVYGVTQSRTRLTWLSSNTSYKYALNILFYYKSHYLIFNSQWSLWFIHVHTVLIDLHFFMHKWATIRLFSFWIKNFLNIFLNVDQPVTKFFTVYLSENILSFGEGNGTPLQYSCLQNPMGGGAW